MEIDTFANHPLYKISRCFGILFILNLMYDESIKQKKEKQFYVCYIEAEKSLKLILKIYLGKCNAK